MLVLNEKHNRKGSTYSVNVYEKKGGEIIMSKIVRKPYWRELRKLDQGVRQSFRRRGDQLDIMQSGRILLYLGFQDAEYVGRLSSPKYEKMTGTYFLMKNETREIEPCKDLEEAKWLASEIAKETGEHFTILKWVRDVSRFSVNVKPKKSKK